VEFVEHTSEDDLERYVVQTLTESAAATLEEHLLICQGCRDRLVAVEEYVAALQAAASGLREKLKVTEARPHRFVHDTEDGLIVSEATRRGRKWFAHNWGPQLDGGTTTETLDEAMVYLIETFQQMFPEHTKCTERCETDGIEKWVKGQT
jgi:hypothetical protein